MIPNTFQVMWSKSRSNFWTSSQVLVYLISLDLFDGYMYQTCYTSWLYREDGFYIEPFAW